MLFLVMRDFLDNGGVKKRVKGCSEEKNKRLADFFFMLAVVALAVDMKDPVGLGEGKVGLIWLWREASVLCFLIASRCASSASLSPSVL